jgi:hypothetical protein
MANNISFIIELLNLIIANLKQTDNQQLTQATETIALLEGAKNTLSQALNRSSRLDDIKKDEMVEKIAQDVLDSQKNPLIKNLQEQLAADQNTIKTNKRFQQQFQETEDVLKQEEIVKSLKQSKS